MTHTAIIRRSYSAAPQRVFAIFASHELFAKALTGPIGEKIGAVRRIQTGDDGADGVGSVRRIGFGPTAFEETIVALQAPKRLEYAITKGSPLRNHHGVVTFTATANGGTAVDYRISFAPMIPGTGAVIALLLEKLIGSGMKRIEGML